METVIIITYLAVGGSLPLLLGFIFYKVYDDLNYSHCQLTTAVLSDRQDKVY